MQKLWWRSIKVLWLLLNSMGHFIAESMTILASTIILPYLINHSPEPQLTFGCGNFSTSFSFWQKTL